MKPAPFKYFAPPTVDEALHLLGEYGYEAKALAGGQSLIPTMNFRLAQPAVLVDLNPLTDLNYIRPTGDGGLRIGAMTRQRQLERDPLIAERAPLLHETMPHIAHPQIRNRGTYGGTLAHADPAAELPAVSVALRARMKIRNREGERWVPAEDFFVALFTTALEPEDLLVEIALPPLPPRTGTAFAEVARRHGDYALAGVAAVVTRNEDDTCADARLVFLSVGDGPVMAHQAAAALRGQPLTPEAIRAAAHTAATADIEPGSDIHASADFRRHLAEVLARRTLQTAAQRAKGGNA
ncbi:MAG: xanthine dehydrogenase family protein subunit M [Caldilineae bacterium]|nr:MAG: xanthine dehydrogenase family protein subunit M [Caldilineae bacterium]